MEPEGTPQTAVKFVRKNSKHRGSLKTVLIMLADFIDDGNNCPSQKELAEATGLSTDTVRRCLGELAKDKSITLTKSGGKKVKGGQKDCYAINRGEAAPEPVTPEPTTTPGATMSLDTGSMEQPGSPIPPSTQQHGGNVIPHVSEGGDAATRVTDLSLEQEQTTTTTAVVVAVPDIPPNDDNLPLVEMAGELGDVARAYERYCRGVLTSQHSDLFTVMIEDYGATTVLEAFKASFGKNDPWGYAIWHLKHPELVNKQTSRSPAPVPKQHDMITTAEKEAARRAFNFDVPEFRKIGATP